MVGWPSEVKTARSVIPCTVARTDLILLAVVVSACKSLPYNLIEFSPLTPETASETLSCKYCEKLNSTPGNFACSWAKAAPSARPCPLHPAIAWQASVAQRTLH